jgi:hypothetical protein
MLVLVPSDPTLLQLVRQQELKLADLENDRRSCQDAAAEADADAERAAARAAELSEAAADRAAVRGVGGGPAAAQVVGFAASEFAVPDGGGAAAPPFAVVVLCRADAAASRAGPRADPWAPAGNPSSFSSRSLCVRDTSLVVDLVLDFSVPGDAGVPGRDTRRRRVYRTATFGPGEEYLALTLPCRPPLPDGPPWTDGRTDDPATGGSANVAAASAAAAGPIAARCRLLSAHVYHAGTAAEAAAARSHRGHEAFAPDSSGDGVVCFGEITEAAVVRGARSDGQARAAAAAASASAAAARAETAEHPQHPLQQRRAAVATPPRRSAAHPQRGSGDGDGGVEDGTVEGGAFAEAGASSWVAAEAAARARLAEVEQQVAAAQETYVRVILEMGGALASLQTMEG